MPLPAAAPPPGLTSMAPCMHHACMQQPCAGPWPTCSASVASCDPLAVRGCCCWRCPLRSSDPPAGPSKHLIVFPPAYSSGDLLTAGVHGGPDHARGGCRRAWPLQVSATEGVLSLLRGAHTAPLVWLAPLCAPPVLPPAAARLHPKHQQHVRGTWVDLRASSSFGGLLLRGPGARSTCSP
jgi:hypothetical protein